MESNHVPQATTVQLHPTRGKAPQVPPTANPRNLIKRAHRTRRGRRFERWLIRFLPVAKRFVELIQKNIPITNDDCTKFFIATFPSDLVERQIRGEGARLLRRANQWSEAIDRDEVCCPLENALGVVWFTNVTRTLFVRWGWTVGEGRNARGHMNSRPLWTGVESPQASQPKRIEPEELNCLEQAIARIEEYLERPEKPSPPLPPEQGDREPRTSAPPPPGLPAHVAATASLHLSRDDSLTNFELTLMQAHHELGASRHKGREIARQAGYESDSRLYSALSGLVKRGYLDSSGRGYSRGPRYHSVIVLMEKAQ
jgi:hypothetical protein